MSDKQFNSIFVFDLKIDVANYIVELLIDYKLMARKKDRPKCAFWRKDIAAQNEKFIALQKEYAVELIFVKKLLMFFSAPTIIEYINFRKQQTLGYLKVDQRKILIYNLFNADIKYKQKMKKLLKQKPKDENLVIKVQDKKTQENKFSGIL